MKKKPVNPRNYHRQFWLITDGNEVRILHQTEDAARVTAKEYGWDILKCEQEELRRLVKMGATVL